MSQPLVSCVVPMYNSENTITECLESIVKIEYRPLEVIIVNDGSTDLSFAKVGDFVTECKDKDIQFFLINEVVNRGISAAKNLGVKNMNGEFYFFAASDDVQLPQRVSAPLSYLDQNPEVDVVFGDCLLWHQNRVGDDGSDSSTLRGFPAGMTNENAFLFQLKRSYLWSGLLFARRSAMLNFDEALSSAVDYDWYFNQYFHGRVMQFISEPFIRYRLHQSNTSKQLSETCANVRKILKKYNFDQVYTDLCRDSPFDDLHMAFAWLDQTIGKHSEALKKLSRLQTRSWEADFLKGVLYTSLNRYAEGGDVFRSLCGEAEGHVPAECLNNLAVCHVHSGGEVSEAVGLLKRAVSIIPDYLDAQNNLSLLKRDTFDVRFLRFTQKPLREVLTHINEYE